MTLPRMFELRHEQPPELCEKEKSDLRIAQHFFVDFDYPSTEEAELNTGESMTILAGNKYAGRLTLDLDIGAKVELNYFNIISKSKTGSESVSELVLEREADQNGAICCNVQVRRRTNFGDEEFQENFAHDYTRKLMMYTRH